VVKNVDRPDSKHNVVAIILNWNGRCHTENAAISVLGEVDSVMIVDNASEHLERDKLGSFVAYHNMTLIQNDRNLGYAGGNNVGIRRALNDGFDAVLIMNNDAAAEPGAVRLLMQHLFQHPKLGAVGPTVVEMQNPDVVVHTACRLSARNGMVDNGLLRSKVRTDPFHTEAISGAAFLARAATFEECGAFNERLVFYFEDIEWSARVQRAGWSLEIVPQSVFRHVVGGSMPSIRGQFYRARNRPIFLRLGLGQSRMRSLIGSTSGTAITMASLLRRGHLWTALRGVLLGWITGVVARD
jgi:GT2 family glycosyltransferase